MDPSEETAASLFTVLVYSCLHLQDRRIPFWRKHVSLKYWLGFTKEHGAISRKAISLIFNKSICLLNNKMAKVKVKL
jgi:hypothetical protein